MEKKKITQEFEKGFNRSSKVMEHKLGNNAAKVLSTLIYKHNVWYEMEKLINIEGKASFWITMPDLMIEINLKKYSIQKAIEILKKEKLIEVHKIGLPARNHYVLDEEAINRYEIEHVDEYEKGIKRIKKAAQADRKRFQSQLEAKEKEVNSATSQPSALIIPQLTENLTTSELNTVPPVIQFSTVTNNKNTNNRNTKTCTNRTSAEERDYPQLDELTEAITRFREANDVDRDTHESMFHLMKNLVPSFSDFSMSHQDQVMIDKFCEYVLDAHAIAFKILCNAHDIVDGTKKERFGNLFVGLEEMNGNSENLFTCYGT